MRIKSFAAISFNSRPHKEVDERHFFSRRRKRLSIHDLTRRSTIPKHSEIFDPVLSIHDLTRRSTSSSGSPSTSRSFQFTTSQGGRLAGVPFSAVAFSFQFTTSQGGRRTRAKNKTRLTVLSIHDLTRRSTIRFPCNFRLLASFNSRPHKEVDPCTICNRFFKASFNSRPHKEVDGNTSLKVSARIGFQFTTSQGGRHF